MRSSLRLDIPFSAASERNKFTILQVLKKYLSSARSVLEIGSGTGQHCIYFARELPHLLWHPSDLTENISTIQLRSEEYPSENLLPPLVIEIGKDEIPSGGFDAIFTANTMHILSNELCLKLFQESASALDKNGLLIIYGPFHYNGRATGEGNAIFDRNLKRMGQDMGIKDIDQIIHWASENNFVLLDDHDMPVDNRTLVFSKII